MTGPLATILAVAAYGALHSLLASPWAKEKARRILGSRSDRLYRISYNAVGALTLLPVLAIPALLPGDTLYRVPWPWSFLTALGQAIALLLLGMGLLQTDVWHFLGLRQLLSGDSDSPPKLVVRGLYRWVRHPLYTAGLVLIWLSPVLTTNLLALNLGFTAYIYIGSLFEEKRLIYEFGEAYLTYQKRVPRLIPRPWRSAAEF
ncbi:MAG: isoprenylcysteine carboxylmethyltransferase family protein [Anaerolineales bacterium]|nr:isoprenylcysteine carboxylmethyltransferase family protein [Anaerolineales bacterium]